MGNSFLHGMTKIKFHLRMYFCKFWGKVFSASSKGQEGGGGANPEGEVSS